jgi:glycerol-3-phosphate cytidylyltransferase-like family protein
MLLLREIKELKNKLLIIFSHDEESKEEIHKIVMKYQPLNLPF